MVVDGQGEQPVITDGPYPESKEHIGGFWIIDVPDLDVALALAAEASKACRGKVEVRAVPDHAAGSVTRRPGTIRMSRLAPSPSAASASAYAGLSCAARAASTDGNSISTVRVSSPSS